MIDVVNLHKSFGDTTVLCGASFSVEPGTITALVGANGTGKTTTLHILAGLTAPDGGTARIDGVDVSTNRGAAQERIAFLPQAVRFHDALTPRQVLRFYAGLRDAPEGSIDSLLDDVALTHAGEQPCGTLSGGMRQRLGLALIELADAPVVLLDEPALSLDPDWRSFLMQRIQAWAENGTTVLLATHLLEVWRPLATRVLRCEDGQVREAEPEPTPVGVPAGS